MVCHTCFEHVGIGVSEVRFHQVNGEELMKATRCFTLISLSVAIDLAK